MESPIRIPPKTSAREKSFPRINFTYVSTRNVPDVCYNTKKTMTQKQKLGPPCTNITDVHNNNKNNNNNNHSNNSNNSNNNKDNQPPTRPWVSNCVLTNSSKDNPSQPKALKSFQSLSKAKFQPISTPPWLHHSQAPARPTQSVGLWKTGFRVLSSFFVGVQATEGQGSYSLGSPSVF